jgi:dienelactone hydrolase
MGRSFDDVLIAQFHLRFGHTLLEAQIYWPPRPLLAGAASLVVLLADQARPHSAELLSLGLSAGAETVVLRVPDRTHGLPTLTWAADHAHELGGQADRVMLAGWGVSGARAARLAIAARDQGWPALQRQVLVHPRFTIACPPPPRLVGVATATIVSGSGPRDQARRYAARLKRAGVEVGELRQPYSGFGQVDDEMRMIAELSRSLQTDVLDQTKGSLV